MGDGFRRMVDCGWERGEAARVCHFTEKSCRRGCGKRGYPWGLEEGWGVFVGDIVYVESWEITSRSHCLTTVKSSKIRLNLRKSF